MKFAALNPLLKGKSSLISACLALMLVASCSQKDPSETEAITNRPQNYEQLIAILKLNSSALLETATLVDGKPQIDPSLLQQILSEQEAVESELLALSPEIEILFRYKFVLNGLAVVAPRELEEHFRKLASVSYVERNTVFEPLETSQGSGPTSQLINNSVAFIGAERVHKELTVTDQDGKLIPVMGQGMTVGIIDSGIDYTHKMFGGTGTPEAFSDNNPDLLEEGSFPNEKVVGGIDLVGTTYHAGSPHFDAHIPRGDADPLDEGGHGTHVAGTVAGTGDLENTYSGVAPMAKLHAIKVFGADGSTSDAVILKALEYAADPNGDDDPADRLDVVNMSLGSSYGIPHNLYNVAVTNLSKGNTVVVASGGNSGHFGYIVGSPGSSDDAISVAASVDNMDHNWKFPAVIFTKSDNTEILAEAVEGAITKPIAEAGDVRGKLVAIGLADRDLEEEEAQALSGNIALIDRGAVAFSDKLTRAQGAGALGAVVANNVDGNPIVMGGDGTFEIPGIMISKALGESVKEAMGLGDVSIQFQTGQFIEKPELIDTLTDFSSRGPRSFDALIKPEIAAPGQAIVSAKMGSGFEGVKFSGTSMASPHVAGVMALLKQIHPGQNAATLKSLLLSTGSQISDSDNANYPVALQGAGRAQAFLAAESKISILPQTLSIGEQQIVERKVLRRQLMLNNLTDEDMVVNLSAAVDQGLTITFDKEQLILASLSQAEVGLTLDLKPEPSADAAFELDGFVKITSRVAGVTSEHGVPVLVVVNQTTELKTSPVKILASSPSDSFGAASELTVKNPGAHTGLAMVFNLLGKDARKPSDPNNQVRHGGCDLESAGYRVIKKDEDGAMVSYLQIAAKLYNPVSTWHTCELSVLVDGNGDGIADQELLGNPLEWFTGSRSQRELFTSILTDANQMRSIRRNYEENYPEVASADYIPAIVDVQSFYAFGHSTVGVLIAKLDLINLAVDGQMHLKVVAIGDSSAPESDDYLGRNEPRWEAVDLNPEGSAFTDLPEFIEVEAGSQTTARFTKGGKSGKAVVYFPQNQSNNSISVKDKQSRILPNKYQF